MTCNRLTCVLMIVLITSSLSCKKNDPIVNPTSIAGKIKTVTYTSDLIPSATSSVYYYYNGDGTLNNTKKGDGTNFVNYETFTYSYLSDKTTINTFDALNNQTFRKEIFTDVTGKVDSIAVLYVPSNSIKSTKIIFNINSQPIKSISYNFMNGTIPTNPSEIYEYTFNNGNMIKRVQIPTDPSTSFQNYFEYEYYTTISNLTPETFGEPHSLIYNIDLVKSEISHSYSTGNAILDNSWIYTFDSTNKVLVETTFSHHSGTPDGHFQKRTFTYY